ncbi:MAG: hypothetical protein ACR2K1_02780, partial [Saprospiraceae bacterium]
MEDGAGLDAQMISYNSIGGASPSANAAAFQFHRGRGSLASPAAVITDDRLGAFLFGGHDGTSIQNGAFFGALCDGTPTAGSVPTRFSIAVGTSGGNRPERLTIKSSGNVGIGTTTPNGNFEVAQATTGPGTVSNTAGGTTVTGTNTLFLNTFKVNDAITIGGQTVTITAIASNTSMTTAAITNANTNAAYTLTGGARLTVLGNGNVGIGTTTPTAALHLKAGTATANSAPLKFTSGTNLTTAEAGAMEYNGTNLLFTPSTVRHTVNHGLTGSATLDFPSTTA